MKKLVLLNSTRGGALGRLDNQMDFGLSSDCIGFRLSFLSINRIGWIWVFLKIGSHLDYFIWIWI
jgi:hypothetical protein